MCGDGNTKVKSQLELDLERVTKKNKIGFCMYLNLKIPGGHLVINTGMLIATNKEKAEVLRNSFCHNVH